jgi:hypothetical protein
VIDIVGPGVDILSCWKGSSTATRRISGTSMGKYIVATGKQSHEANYLAVQRLHTWLALLAAS